MKRIWTRCSTGHAMVRVIAGFEVAHARDKLCNPRHWRSFGGGTHCPKTHGQAWTVQG